MNAKPILLVDDDEELGVLVTEYLSREGYGVQTATDGRTGLELAASGAFALVLLDIMLPGLDGLDVVRELRKSSATPVIMLTAKGDEVDRIVGLELGADDYLPKPFNPRELSARIKAVLRRSSESQPTARPEAGGDALNVGGVTIDLAGYRAFLHGEELALTTIEFALLRELVGAAGRVLSRDILLDRVRGRDFESFDRSIDVHISHLRQKLGDTPAEPRFIKTVRTVGYMFIGG